MELDELHRQPITTRLPGSLSPQLRVVQVGEERIPQTAGPVIRQPTEHRRGESLLKDHRHPMPEMEMPCLAHVVEQGRLQQCPVSMPLSL